MSCEIRQYLRWRRRTRFIRRHGGLLLALAILLAAGLVLWRGKMRRYESSAEPFHFGQKRQPSQVSKLTSLQSDATPDPAHGCA